MTQNNEQMIMGFPVFSGYTEHGVRSMIERGEIQSITPGETIIVEGQPSTEVLLVLSGKLAAFVERNGRPLALADLGPGSLVGELGVLCGIPRSASVRADEPATVLRWDSRAFRSMLLGDPALSERIFRQSLRTLIEHDRAMIEQITRLPRP